MASTGLDVPAQCEAIQPILCGSAHGRETFITGQKAHLSFQCHYCTSSQSSALEMGSPSTQGQVISPVVRFIDPHYTAIRCCPQSCGRASSQQPPSPDLSSILGLWEESKSTQQELNHLWQLQLTLKLRPYKGLIFWRGHKNGHHSSQSVALSPLLPWHSAHMSETGRHLVKPSFWNALLQGGRECLPPRSYSLAIISG